jgi:hypothetical protein
LKEPIPATRRLKRITIIISSVLFVISLTQKAYCTTSQCGDSIMAFLLGWFALFSGGAGISWIANPLLFISWVTMKKNVKKTVLLSAIATLFALSFLLFSTITSSESGHSQQIIAWKAGYWIWLSSCATTFTGCVIILLKEKRPINIH